MPKAKFEFQIKRGVIDVESQEEHALLITKCIDLCKSNNHEEAVAQILPHLIFEWIWSNCDGDPSEIMRKINDLSFPCSFENCLVKLGEDSGHLVVTATVFFYIDVKKGWTQDKLSDWLSDNSAYACGYVGAGWDYIGSDGENVWVTDVTDTI